MWQKVDFIQQSAMIDSVVGPRRSSEALPKAKLAPKRRSESLFGGLLTIWSTSFVNPGKTITSEKSAHQINEQHWKLHCLQLALVNRKGPVLLCNNAQPCVTPPTLQKLNKLGYEVLPHPPNSPDLSLTDYHFFKHFNNFLQGQCFHNQ